MEDLLLKMNSNVGSLLDSMLDEQSKDLLVLDLMNSGFTAIYGENFSEAI